MAPPTGRIPGMSDSVRRIEEGREEKVEKRDTVSDLPRGGTFSSERPIESWETEGGFASDSALGKFLRETDPDSFIGRIVREFEASAGLESYFGDKDLVVLTNPSQRPTALFFKDQNPTQAPTIPATPEQMIASALGVHLQPQRLPSWDEMPILGEGVLTFEPRRDTDPILSETAYAREMEAAMAPDTLPPSAPPTVRPSVTPEQWGDYLTSGLRLRQPVTALELGAKFTGRPSVVEVDPVINWRIEKDGIENGKLISIEYFGGSERRAKLTDQLPSTPLSDTLFQVWRENGEYRISFYQSGGHRWEGGIAVEPPLLGASPNSPTVEAERVYGFLPGQVYSIRMGENRLLIQF